MPLQIMSFNHVMSVNDQKIEAQPLFMILLSVNSLVFVLNQSRAVAIVVF